MKMNYANQIKIVTMDIFVKENVLRLIPLSVLQVSNVDF